MMTHIIKRAKKLTKSYFQHRKNLKKSEIKKPVSQKLGITCLVSLLASCQPSYANSGLKSFKSNSDFLTELNKINQLSFFDSFNYVAKVAVTGNNLKQEPRKLLATVLQHHTIVDVFLCLSFANCLFTGELRLALALVRLWWGGHGNKPFIGRIPCAVLLRFSSLPTALTLGQIIKTSLPLEKV